MDYLVLCPCSHGLDRHSGRGCAGTGNSACSCPLNAFEALGEAVDRARSQYSIAARGDESARA
jgi:hypothetical protein